MRNPTRVLLWMCLFLLVLAGIIALFYGPLMTAFLANPLFNGMILGVFLLGVILNLRQVAALNAQERWIEDFREGNIDKENRPPPAMLSPMSKLLTGRRGDRLSLSTVSLRTLLDGIRSRVDESRDMSRYMIGLLVFLGLLGTFWGLLATLASVGDVIEGLSVGGDDIEAIFTELKAGLQAPLAGMGTAFSSSLFGLGGSLALGFLDLQAGHAQNRFVNELEEWLAGQTKLSSGFLGGEGE
ncbi:MAG: flagellar motor protein MotA, partial [Candidatus Competibacteraceae bacterium]|nr:flagellar motor protein MotA [Candidatus Competibacteraceae bacterium]